MALMQKGGTTILGVSGSSWLRISGFLLISMSSLAARERYTRRPLFLTFLLEVKCC